MITITIKEAAKELAAALKQTSEYVDLMAAQARIQLDPAAQDIIARMNEIQQRMEASHAQGFPVEEEVKEYYQAQHQAMANTTLQKFFQAQEDFGKVLQQANDILNNELAE